MTGSSIVIVGKRGKPLSQYVHNSGYLAVKMNNKRVMIHHIITNHFLGERPKHLVVNHKDGNKLNNDPSNLEYCTQADNIRHANALGLNPTYTWGNPKDRRISVKEYHLKNKEAIAVYKAEWYRTNKDRISANNKIRYAENKEAIKARNNARYHANKQKGISND